MSGASTRPLPLRCGIGLKSSHFASVLDTAVRGAGQPWVEVHPQNYMMDGGPMHHWLKAIGEVIPLSFHSVGLSLGDPGGCDSDELERLALLTDRYRPSMVSEHLSWSSVDGEKLPDLLPVPMTGETLDHFAVEIERVQDRLGRSILIENPSRLLAFAADDYDEVDFLQTLASRSGCGLLLDINNVIVSAINLDFDPVAYIDAIAPDLVGEIHIAGHKIETDDDGGQTAIDDHGSPIGDLCWALAERFVARAGPRPLLVERDNDVPSYAALAAEAARGDQLLTGRLAHAA